MPAEGVREVWQEVSTFNAQQVVSSSDRDPLGVLAPGGIAYDPLGHQIVVQNPVAGQPPSGAQYGPSYFSFPGGFTDAYNFSAGCLSVYGNPAACSNAMRERMGQEFWDNLPGVYNDMERGEQRYLGNLDATYQHIHDTTEHQKYVNAFRLMNGYRNVNGLFDLDLGNARTGGEFNRGGQSPQNILVRRLTDKEFSGIRRQLENALTDQCKKFIDRLISYNTGKSFSSKDELLDYIDRSAQSSKHGIFFRGTVSQGLPGGVEREKSGDLAKIYIGSMPSFPERTLSSAVEAQYRGYASTLLHEAIHALTHGSDDRLSANIQKLGIVPIGRDGKPMDFPAEGSNIYAYSAYWDTALKNACFPDL